MPLNIVNNPAPEPEDDSFVSEPLDVSSPVFLATVKAGELDKIDEYLQREPRLAASRDAVGCSALLLAIYHEHDAVAQRLLELPDVIPTLCETAALGDLEQLGQLLGAPDVDVAQTTPDGSTALALASFYGHSQIVDRLLDAGAPVNQVSDNLQSTTALHQAVAHRHADIALEISQRLLQAGASVNTRQAGGFTALHQAATRGRRPLVQLLLTHGADPKLASDQGRTASELARQRQHHLPELE